MDRADEGVGPGGQGRDVEAVRPELEVAGGEDPLADRRPVLDREVVNTVSDGAGVVLVIDRQVPDLSGRRADRRGRPEELRDREIDLDAAVSRAGDGADDHEARPRRG